MLRHSSLYVTTLPHKLLVPQMERNVSRVRLHGERTQLACRRARPRDRELLSFALNDTENARNKRLFRRDAETRSPRRPLLGMSAHSLLVIPSGEKRSRGISRATPVSAATPRVMKQILLRVSAVFSEVRFRELP